MQQRDQQQKASPCLGLIMTVAAVFADIAFATAASDIVDVV